MGVRSLLLWAALATGCSGATAAAPPSDSPHDPAPEQTERDPLDLMSVPDEYAERPISRDAGEEYFGEFGMGDPYSAGIAYPVLLALLSLYPSELGGNVAEFTKRFGFIPAEDSPLPVGFHLTEDPLTNVSFAVMNCQVCHSARLKVAGNTQVVLGLGNKRLRIHEYDAALMKIAPRLEFKALLAAATRAASKARTRWPLDMRAPIITNTIEGFRRRVASRGAGVKRLRGGKPGRVATIGGFTLAMNYHNQTNVPLPQRIGWVKIPDVLPWRWRTTNSFDGVVKGSPVALVAEADFAFGVRPKWYEAQRHIATSMFLYLKSFERDLPFPGPIDQPRAQAGFGVFNDKCAGCHGHYQAPGAELPEVSYHESVIGKAILKTDTVRLEAVTTAFVDAANAQAATRGLTHAEQTGGYVPRPLVNVWARGLFGHNGAWPTLKVLATPPADRPTRYVVMTDAEYDLQQIGTRYRTIKPDEAPTLAPGEYIYDSTQAGFGVQGHEFLSQLPATDRGAVIEYLKTL